MGTTTYRRFDVNDRENEFVITELEPTTRHPINWTGPVTRETAWKMATAQAVQPIVIKLLDGTVQTHAALNEFDLHNFELFAYLGYVGYGCSMTDGAYHPISQAQYVDELRRDAVSFMENGFAENPITDYNDCRLAVKNSFGEYASRLVRSLVK